MESPAILITVNGRPALTVAQAAARLGMTASGLRRDLAREPNAPTSIAPLDGRTPLYDVDAMDGFGEYLRSRPGKGRSHK